MSQRTLRVAATYIGAVMGAGFASGQEIIQFFVSYGVRGLWGIILAGILFTVLGYLTLFVIRRHRIQNYQKLFNLLLGQSLGKVCELTVTLFLFAGLVIMLAGSGAIFSEYFNLKPSFGVILTSLAVLIALASKGEGVMWINTVLVPLKLVICLAVSIAVLRITPNTIGITTSMPVNPSRPWFISAVLYVSFNMTFTMVVLATLGQEIKGNVAGGLLGGAGLGLFALAIGTALLRFYPSVAEYQVPMVYIAFQVGTQMGIFYLLVLWFAMITAAVGNAFSFVKRITTVLPYSYRTNCLGTIALAIPLAHFKFSVLVSVIYPLFGYIGLVTLCPLIYLAVSKK